MTAETTVIHTFGTAILSQLPRKPWTTQPNAHARPAQCHQRDTTLRFNLYRHVRLLWRGAQNLFSHPTLFLLRRVQHCVNMRRNLLTGPHQG